MSEEGAQKDQKQLRNFKRQNGTLVFRRNLHDLSLPGLVFSSSLRLGVLPFVRQKVRKVLRASVSLSQSRLPSVIKASHLIAFQFH